MSLIGRDWDSESATTRRARASAEETFTRRWYSRKYGLSASETTRLLRCGRLDLLERDLDAWRAQHGFPATTSPLSRGKLLELASSGRYR